MFDVLTLPPFVSACIQGLGVACIGRRASMSGMSASMMLCLCSGLQASAFCREALLSKTKRVKFQVVVEINTKFELWFRTSKIHGK